LPVSFPIFFFSSRRRHTRFSRDWSSDVCSSDLVEYIRTEPGRFAHGEYKGYMAELENVRNAVRAWALTHGHEVTDRPFEFYKNGIDNAFTADGEFEVFWRLRE